MSRCAVIGAGAAGLAAARLLHARGLTVTVFDKGRQSGGRLASRRTAHGSFDHGLRYLSADSEWLRQSLQAQSTQGCTATWAVSLLDDRQAAVGQAFVGVPTNNQMARYWATGLNVLQEQHVESLQREGARWQLRVAGQPQPLEFDAVVITVPQPQLQPLLPGLALPPALERIAYDSCWTLLWVPTATELPQLLPFSPVRDPCIDWIAREDSKPGRSGPPRYVVHATAMWSLQMLEHSPEAAAAALQTAAAALLGIAPQAHFATAHRWRYAHVRQALEIPQLTLASRLHYASDGCLGDGLEHAMASGTAAATALLATLS